MKKKSLEFSSKGVGYSTAVFYNLSNHGISLSKNKACQRLVIL
ncbi:hypothetical protein CLV36_104133 [Laceyella sediminis]|jgi:hypothetical protein|uniref:Transposase n=1 Tax=Laceyella sediminis TaxID=573074 RepID=A0ABX5EQZ5_9BACL|nr:hypothetical protein [Laceyella sediminis]PRZ15410.1 hypothetical protein CLV36_104133 [Laceyella sediminis]